MKSSRSPSKTRARVAGLVTRPQVLDDLVGVEDVVAHLVAPAGLDVALAGPS